MKEWEVVVVGVVRYEESHDVEAETQEEAEQLALEWAEVVGDVADAKVVYTRECTARERTRGWSREDD